MVHEWFGVLEAVVATELAGDRTGDRTADCLTGVGASRRSSRSDLWLPPLGMVLAVLRWSSATEGGAVLWIGRRVWADPSSLAGMAGASAEGRQWGESHQDLLRRSIFIDPPSFAERVWAIELALRSPAVDVVVADGSGLRMAESRRLQLAAAGGDALAILLRPPWEVGELSAAHRRWMVEAGLAAPVAAGGSGNAAQPSSRDRRIAGTHPSDAGTRGSTESVHDSWLEPTTPQCWSVHLLRCKGMQPISEEARCWTVQRDHATGDVRVVSDVSDRPAATA